MLNLYIFLVIHILTVLRCRFVIFSFVEQRPRKILLPFYYGKIQKLKNYKRTFHWTAVLFVLNKRYLFCVQRWLTFVFVYGLLITNVGSIAWVSLFLRLFPPAGNKNIKDSFVFLRFKSIYYFSLSVFCYRKYDVLNSLKVLTRYTV